MSFEINPVLAGKFDAPPDRAVQSATLNTHADDVTGPDPRRYTQFDRTITDAGETTMSFGDFIDMINPLQHIPVVSSIYRAVTGEEIHPVSRVAGDILYGGLFGAASAVLGGVSAVADAGLEAQTGKDSGGIVLSMLFGDDDDDKSVQLADAGQQNSAPAALAAAPATEAPKQLADVAAPALKLAAAPAKPAVEALDLADAATLLSPQPPPASPASGGPSSKTIELAQIASANPMMAALAMQDAIGSAGNIKSAAKVAAETEALTSRQNVTPANTPAPADTPIGAIPMATENSANGKLPYGGVMGNGMARTGKTPDSATMALASDSSTTRMGNMIYTNRFANGRHSSTPPQLSSTGATKPAATPVYAPVPTMPSVSGSLGSTNSNLIAAQAATQNAAFKNPLPPALVQDMMTKAMGRYKDAAAYGRGAGSGINLVN